MKFKLQTCFSLILLILIGIESVRAEEKKLINPLLIDQNKGCQSENLNQLRFSMELETSRKIKICQSVVQVLSRINQGVWSTNLKSELVEIWTIYSQNNVYFARMPVKESSDILAMTESFSTEKDNEQYFACIYLNKKVEEKKWFYQVFLHEIKHVFDFYYSWSKGKNISEIELERRAFRLMSQLDEETPKKIRHSKIPQLWKDKWKKLARPQIEFNREEAITNYLRKSSFYKNFLENDPNSEDVSEKHKSIGLIE